MMKKMSLRLRLTILSIALLTVCCVFLTVILNFSANQMANVIEAIPIVPANQVGEDGKLIENAPLTSSMPMVATTEKSQDARRLFLYESIAYMVIVVAVGGGLTYYISGKALKPINQLSNQMKNRTVRNLSESLPIPESHDEVADLTVSFNEMSRKLEVAFATQKRFSQSAAHELRTPLTVLKTKVDVFKKKTDHKPEEYDDFLTVISTHTNRLSHLVKDLLELTNLDALECDEQIKIKKLLSEVTGELGILAEGKNIHIAILGQEHIIKGNQSLLHRAFYNIIENAIKYNHENGSVEILLSVQDSYLMVKIRDSGMGIPEEMKEYIFEPFFRVDKSRSRQMGGAGIGLATVKSIIDNHGGEITVLDHDNGGTVFEIKLDTHL